LRREPDVLSVENLREHFVQTPALLEHGERSWRYFDDIDEEQPPQSLAVARLAARGETIGFLCALSYTPGKRFDEGQRKLLHTTADRASAAIENARLYEDLQATFKQTIRGLASAIDKMDRYTAGHSARVAAYAQILAIKLGLSDEDIEIVRQSALMHDIGKIGCVMNLNKPGRLSQADYEIFKQHPVHGRDILQPIEFLHPLIPGVHLHHERWDGLGYPLGLKGTEVPLIARIIAVADTYDAMTSNRAYRKALAHDIAMSEIGRCGGSQFDPDIAHGFLESIEEFRAEGHSLEEFPDVRETRSGIMAPRS
jgi:HD-GYP domain-containing protein (c-di-GMP phosphodiesterase class II)